MGGSSSNASEGATVSEDSDPRQSPLWKQWNATYERHNFGPAGWATLGAEMKDGVCVCPVCRIVLPVIGEPPVRAPKKKPKK